MCSNTVKHFRQLFVGIFALNFQYFTSIIYCTMYSWSFIALVFYLSVGSRVSVMYLSKGFVLIIHIANFNVMDYLDRTAPTGN